MTHRPPLTYTSPPQLKHSLTAPRHHRARPRQVPLKSASVPRLRPKSPPSAGFQSLPTVPKLSGQQYGIRRSESRPKCP